MRRASELDPQSNIQQRHHQLPSQNWSRHRSVLSVLNGGLPIHLLAGVITRPSDASDIVYYWIVTSSSEPFVPMLVATI